MAHDDPLLPSTSFLQTDLWAAFKEGFGWHAHKVAGILVLERPLPIFGKTFLYSPEVVAEPELLLKLLPEIHAIAKRRNSIFYRLELLVDRATPLAEQWQSAFVYTKFEKSFEEVQPEHRQIVPLGHDEAAVLAQMKQKGRYNIRLAEKSGIFVRETTPKTKDDDVSTFYRLFAQTAKRDKFSIRPKSYFQQLVTLLYEHNCGRLFVATFEGEPVAAAIITLYDGYASYLYGASGDRHREKMGPYGLHWAAMLWSITQGAKAYDLLAIRPTDWDTKKKHAYDGITQFKQQFGGQSTSLLGSWDLPLDPGWYTLFSSVEKLRRR